VTDDIDNEATQDNNTLFSEIQLTGDIDEPSSTGTTLDTDYRLSRLRRSTIIDRRTSSSLSTRTNSVINIEKVIKTNSFYSIHIDEFFFLKKKFPGIADKRDRLQLIDYDQLTIHKKTDNNSKVLKRNQSVLNPKSKLILPDKMIYIHIKTLNEGQYFVSLISIFYLIYFVFS
jgi:hypothetical protein